MNLVRNPLVQEYSSSAPVHSSEADMLFSLPASMLHSDSSLEKKTIDEDNSFSHKRKQNSETSTGNLVMI